MSSLGAIVNARQVARSPRTKSPTRKFFIARCATAIRVTLSLFRTSGVRERVQAASDLPAQMNTRRFIAYRQYIRRSTGEMSPSTEPHDRCKNGAAHL
jgi:hypothetical protein